MLNLASITLVMGKVPTDVNSSLGCTGVALISGYWFQHHQCVGVFKDKDFVKTVDMDGQGDWEIFGKTTCEGPKELSVWEKVYTNMEKADFTFVFGIQEIPCHMIVLAAASPVLRAMVENQHREAIERKANIKRSAFVHIIYTGKLDATLLNYQTFVIVY